MYSSVFYMSAHRKTEWSTTLILYVQTPEFVTRVKKSASDSNLNLDIVISLNPDNRTTDRFSIQCRPDVAADAGRLPIFSPTAALIKPGSRNTQN